MEELKPCKCGSVDIHEEVMSDNKSHIACQVCGFEIITDYPEWSFELWNTRAKEVIMSEPLSNKKHQYECICCHCGKPFYGDKREVSCPNCSKTNRSLSKVLGLERRKESPHDNCTMDDNWCYDCNMVVEQVDMPVGNHKYNEALKDLDQRSPDVELLSDVIRNCEFKNSMNTTDKILAQEIINKIDVWVVKESSGQCNHEFMQQYDFSKFSNAGNSLKCVKCGLIKKG